MNDLIKILYEIIANIPSNLMVTGLVAYLIWERTKNKKKDEDHAQEHKRIDETNIKEHQLILKEMSELKETQKEDVNAHNKMYMMSLKLGIVNENIPRYARLEMYDEYEAMGGNSWVEAYVDKNIRSPEPAHNRRKDDPKF